jgi:hypothetical protein
METGTGDSISTHIIVQLTTRNGRGEKMHLV